MNLAGTALSILLLVSAPAWASDDTPLDQAVIEGAAVSGVGRLGKGECSPGLGNRRVRESHSLLANVLRKPELHNRGDPQLVAVWEYAEPELRVRG